MKIVHFLLEPFDDSSQGCAMIGKGQGQYIFIVADRFSSALLLLSSDHNINRAGLTRSVECDGGGQEESLHCWHRGRRPPSYGGPPLLSVVLRLRHQRGGVQCASTVS